MQTSNRMDSDQLTRIKWLGIVTMTIDHIGAILFPHVHVLRILGRLALPCFLMGVYEGTHRTRHYSKYVLRMLGLGVLSIPVTSQILNVMFLLVLFSLSVRHRQLLIPTLIASYFVEYGIYGFLLGQAIVWMRERNKTEGTMFGILLTPLSGNPFQMLSGLLLPFLTFDWRVHIPKGPKVFFYLYYPLHQLVLQIIANYL